MPSDFHDLVRGFTIIFIQHINALFDYVLDAQAWQPPSASAQAFAGFRIDRQAQARLDKLAAENARAGN